MLRTSQILLAIPFLLLVPGWSAAQSLSPKDIDARLESQLYEVLKLGTDIYNRGSQDACYRLYQGSLMSIVGFLEHRPDYVIRINRALKETNDMTNVSERAFTLRKVIDDLRADIKPVLVNQQANSAPTGNTPGKQSLWIRLGGELTVPLLVDDLVGRVLKNPRINFVRRGTGDLWDANPENITKLKRQFTLWISSVSGGPLKYESKDMKTVHQKMKISDAEFEFFIDELKASLNKYFVPPAEMSELVRQFDAVKKEIVDSTVVKPLWERLGGEPMVTLMVDDFVSRVSKNANVNFSRKGEAKEWPGTPVEVTALKKQLVQWISSVTGGPLKYTGKSIKDAHIGMKVTNGQFTALVLDLKASLDLCKVNQAEQEELLSIVSGFRKDIVEAK